MPRCKACGKQVRKTRIAVVVGPGGQSKGGRVCLDCERGGMLVVASVVAPVVEAPPRQREEHHVLEPYVLALQAQLRASNAVIGAMTEDDDERAFQEGRREATEAAIKLLRGGRT